MLINASSAIWIMTEVQLTDAAICKIGAAVFEKPGAQVLEAYSEFDKEPRQFRSAPALVECIKERLLSPLGGAFFFVIYPDMGGRAVRKTIHLDPAKVPGHPIRYTWEGWGSSR
ncbi:MAG: hypothetical protein JWQ49_5001 [Edaphobacter sp.]|nr:hypothetical protein [Edaphobacter sp.]